MLLLSQEVKIRGLPVFASESLDDYQVRRHACEYGGAILQLHSMNAFSQCNTGAAENNLFHESSPPNNHKHGQNCMQSFLLIGNPVKFFEMTIPHPVLDYIWGVFLPSTTDKRFSEGKTMIPSIMIWSPIHSDL